ncbi:hypothetical protein D3C75_869350 [compost metagenome]
MQLVNDEGFIAIDLKQLDLGRTHIGDAEMAHLSRRFELVQCLGDFLGVHQRIGPVQQQNIDILRSQAGEGSVDTAQDMFLGKVEHIGAVARLH